MFIVVLAMLGGASSLHERALSEKERSDYWWEHIVKHTFTQQDWLENFRISHDTFAYLCSKLRSAMERNDTIMRKAVSVEKRVVLTLWFLSTGSDYRTIGHLFGVSKATVCVATKQVCSVIMRVLLPTYVKVPTGEALTYVVEGFKNDHGFHSVRAL